jgi:hypothetical protein
MSLPPELTQLRWFKASFSNNGGECVETAHLTEATWFKASYSNAGNECVEAARVQPGMAVRDSKNPDRAAHSFSRSAWTAFIDGIKHS